MKKTLAMILALSAISVADDSERFGKVVDALETAVADLERSGRLTEETLGALTDKVSHVATKRIEINRRAGEVRERQLKVDSDNRYIYALNVQIDRAQRAFDRLYVVLKPLDDENRRESKRLDAWGARVDPENKSARAQFNSAVAIHNAKIKALLKRESKDLNPIQARLRMKKNDLEVARRTLARRERERGDAKAELDRILTPAKREATSLHAELQEELRRIGKAIRAGNGGARASHHSLSNALAQSAAQLNLIVAGVPRAMNKHVFHIGAADGERAGWLAKSKMTESLRRVGSYLRQRVIVTESSPTFRPRLHIHFRTNSGEIWRLPFSLPAPLKRFQIRGSGVVVAVRA